MNNTSWSMFEDTLLITDKETGLIFEIYENYKFFDQPVTLVEAKKKCEKIGPGWRLPDLKELQKLYNDYHLYNLIDFKANDYWTNQNGSGPFYSHSYYVVNFKTGQNTLFGGSKNYFIPVKTFGKINGLVLTNSLNEIETALFEISSSLGELLTITRQKEHSNMFNLKIKETPFVDYILKLDLISNKLKITILANSVNNWPEKILKLISKKLNGEIITEDNFYDDDNRTMMMKVFIFSVIFIIFLFILLSS